MKYIDIGNVNDNSPYIDKLKERLDENGYEWFIDDGKLQIVKPEASVEEIAKDCGFVVDETDE